MVRANVGPAAGLPADGAVRIQFDRFLLPSTVTRQSVLLVDSHQPPNALNPVVSYDPVARVVTLSRQQGLEWLVPDQPYRVLLHVATGPDDANGLRAIDGAPLFAGDPMKEIGFLTTPASGTPFAEPHADFCADVLPIFQRSCSTVGGACHVTPGDSNDPRFGGGKSAPAAGLVLDTSEGVLATALNRVANGANTGPLAGQGAPPARDFGIDMPIIAPRDPGNSWLLYKMLLAAPSAPPDARLLACDGSPGAPHIAPFTPSDFATPTTDAERARLGDFVLGQEMPYPAMTPAGAAPTGLEATFDELERVRLWIAQGAVVTACPRCGP